MLVDIHTNLMWYPDHMSDEFVEFAYAAKKAKMRLSDDVYYAGHADRYKNAFDSTPETLLKATEDCDRVVVFGLKAPYCGVNVPQELVAGFVAENADRFIGWCSVDPNDEDAVEQLEYNVNELGLRGLKVAPIYQHFDPRDPAYLPLFRKAETLDIPVIWHQGTSFVRLGPLKWANPIQLEDIAVACPDLRMMIAHMGHPWEDECVVLIRKHPNLYADISALHYRPLRHYMAFMSALEYGVEHKLIFGSDFPSATPAQVIAGQWKVNDVARNTSLPVFPEEAIHNMIYENWKAFLREA
ncbi:MAG: amidohydrolase family protein [Gemmatimonadetes bacterium]|nr:amidohydrolase family protein [Gemmatimonadota bacterium]